MLGFMNEEAFRKTKDEGVQGYFFNAVKQTLDKRRNPENYLMVKEILKIVITILY